MSTKRAPADYESIANTIKTKIIPSINDAQDDIADILEDAECSAQFIRNATGLVKELDRAEKSASAAALVAKMEAE